LKLGSDWTHVEQPLLEAHQLSPERAEPAWTLAVCHRLAQRYSEARRFAGYAAQLEEPEMGLETSIYRWKALDEYATILCCLDEVDEALCAIKYLLANPDLPSTERDRLLQTRKYCIQQKDIRDA